ncbi:ral guanine nucleotide dissociation stimulator-like 1 isoform X2 [Trichomycterus rosablanca]|uniref:ral guanine nucleotide dissociation stimulator-like 1 isoform X2 n=1 Tax=Trichomycterus rosablanca TaxID=2290929 RepID=UPI002F358FBE
MGKWQLTMDPVQEWGEEVQDGVVYGVTLHREPAPLSEAACSSVSCVQYRTLKVRRVKAAALERLVSELVDPQCDEPDYARIFLSTHKAFTCTKTLIELLFQREDKFTNVDNSTREKRSSLLDLVRLWLEEFGEDFRDSPHHPSLGQLHRHLRHRLCYRRLAQHAQSLLHTFQEEDTRVKTEGSKVAGVPVEAEGGQEETASLLSFSARDIAEELTRLDAALFVRVVPFHCLGCVWSQRDKKENRSLAPGVRATIAQFNSVTNRVITSLLCPTPTPAASGSDSPKPPPSPKAQRSPRSPRLQSQLHAQLASCAQRARIIERWISVAQECHQLRNFSSLRAILSALQSNSVYRLKKTWTVVSRESVTTFDQLCENFPDENCVLTNKEILEDGNQQSEEEQSTAVKSPKNSPTPKSTSCSGAEVPYLGTYLTVLTMLDTALPDTLEGGLINFEKRRREFEVLAQIRQLQASCSLYSVPPRPCVSALLCGCTALSDQQSHDLSRELEPPIDTCPGSPGWSQRLITKKLGSLLSSTESSGKKTSSDQISVSSSGSSSSELEELSSPIRPKSQSGSGVITSPDSSGSSPVSHSSSQSDLSGLSSDGSSPSSSSSSSSSPSPASCKLSADSCIIRVSMELDSGNLYKSILKLEL